MLLRTGNALEFPAALRALGRCATGMVSCRGVDGEADVKGLAMARSDQAAPFVGGKLGKSDERFFVSRARRFP